MKGVYFSIHSDMYKFSNKLKIKCRHSNNIVLTKKRFFLHKKKPSDYTEKLKTFDILLLEAFE
ncbi:hypothetical protein APP_08630 [Aeribacillus pallidus]|nr:hypothetical protein APP_08630 [Aeribacillus pallidus]